jgi:hypothetical protein
MVSAVSRSVAIGVLFLAVIMIVPGGAFATGNSSPTPPTVTLSCASLLPNAAVQGNVDGIYSFLENNTTFSFDMSRAAVTTSTESLFGSLCSTPQFAAVASAAGIQRVTLEYQFHGGDARFANFTLSWLTSDNGVQYAHRVYWSGDLHTGLVSGPYSMVAKALFEGYGYVGANWAGYEFWWSSGGSKLTLWRDAAYTKVVSMSNPGTSTQKNVPPGITVDAIGAAWVGLSPNFDGSGGLFQTGYIYDASNPSSGTRCTGASNGCNNNLWYEYYPNIAITGYSGNPQVASGNVLDEEPFNGGSGYWTAEIYDYTTGNTWTASYYVGTSWAPTYATGIMEATQYGRIQQIPDFSSAVDFEYGSLQTTSSCRNTCVPWDSFYNGGTYNSFQINQELNVLNTNEAFAHCTGYVNGGSTTCYQVTWSSSAYDYNYV